MLKNLIQLPLNEYCINYGVREQTILKELRDYTNSLANGHMQITPDQGALMAMLAKLINAKNYLEIGVFTGYSSLVMALNLPENAIITAIDKDIETLQIAKNYWHKAGVANKIIALSGDALTSLEQLALTQKNYYDIAFIDANKSAYDDYYEYCLQLVRPNGLIIIDNVLMRGQVLDADNAKNYVQVLNKLNIKISNDSRVDICMLAIGDGITLARKKEFTA